jgi:glycine dehydrogenase subunit 2
VTGLAAFTLQPAAGAHGEFTGILIAGAYHRSRRDRKRTEILVSGCRARHESGVRRAGRIFGAHGALAAGRAAGSGALKAELGPQTALVMLTVPNTLGLFESHIREIADAVHAAGALLYMDGANFNALMGLAKPADFGVDILHLNLHKSFSTPHGGGGPGSGPVGVTAALEKFLPVPRVVEKNGPSLKRKKPGEHRADAELPATWAWRCGPTPICAGTTRHTLRSIAENAILNANYARVKLKDLFPSAVDEPCMHECVLQTEPERLNGVKTLDVAKRLLDHGFYAPTIYFPLIVHEAIMIEPTETETRETLDAFVGDARDPRRSAVRSGARARGAAHLPVKRLDELAAARNPERGVVGWTFRGGSGKSETASAHSPLCE